MTTSLGTILSISNTEAKLTILRADGSRRVVELPLEDGLKMRDSLRAKGYDGKFPRSSRPKINVRERLAALEQQDNVALEGGK